MLLWITTHSPHPGPEPQQAERQQLESRAEQEPLVLWLLVGPVQLVGLCLGEAASLAVDMVDTVRSTEAVVAGKNAAAVELRDGRGEPSKMEQRELNKWTMESL